MLGDDWNNIHFDSTFREMLIKRLDEQNKMLEKICEILAQK